MLYGVHLSDMTFAYRIFPTKLVRGIRWEELRHAFLFETLVKPLRLGVPVIEIPSPWKARTEGKSQNAFFPEFRLLSNRPENALRQHPGHSQAGCAGIERHAGHP